MKKEIIYLSVLAQKLAASKECVEPFKQAALDSIEAMQAILPHGSGIDDACYIDTAKSRKDRIVIYFDYHHMNENGYYTRWTHHNLILTPSFANGFDMRITGPNTNQCKDYFYELFSDVFTIDAPNTIVTRVYTFEQLTPQAQDKALDNLRETQLDYEWWEGTYSDAENVGLKITGFDLDRGSYCKGEFINDAEHCANSIIKKHGENCETYKTANAYLIDLRKWQKIQDEAQQNEDEKREDEALQEIETIGEDFLKSILEDYRIILQHEYEYLLSDAAIKESIEANEYTFNEAGKMENL